SIDYILSKLPEYFDLKNIIDHYPETMGDNMSKIHKYTTALERFGDLGYYDIEERLLRSLDNYQIDMDKALMPMSGLSGGQKRFVELVIVQFSEPELALIDEPTNHMDYIAKNTFIKWLENA